MFNSPKSERLTTKKPFYGWWVMAALMSMLMLGGGMVTFSFTTLFDPLGAQFGWSKTSVSVAAALRGVEDGIGALFVGFLVDRFGGRKIVFAGVILMASGFILLSRMNSLATFYIFFIIVCIGVSLMSTVVGTTILAQWFRRRLGTALGIYTVGAGLSGFLVYAIIFLLDKAGVLNTFLYIGIFTAVIGLTAAFLVRDRPQQLGYGPDGDPLEKDPGLSLTRPKPKSLEIVKQASRTLARNRVFWTLVFMAIAHLFVAGVVITHMMPYLQSIGWSRVAAGEVASAFPLVSILGRIGFGWLGDRFSRKGLLIVSMMFQVVGIIILMFVGLQVLIFPAIFLYATGFGGMVPNRQAIVHDYFGAKNFGTTVGIITGIGYLGNIVGPIMAARIYDSLNSYLWALIISIVFISAAALSMLTLQRPSPVKVAGQAG